MYAYFIPFCQHGTLSAPYLGPNYDYLNTAVGWNENFDDRFRQAGRSLLTAGRDHFRVHRWVFMNTSPIKAD
jgi:hypothetical protein